MSKKNPNKFIAPIVITGIAVGFLVSAYKFFFTQPKPQKEEQEHDILENIDES